MYEKPPLSILVLPPTNESTAAEVRSIIKPPLPNHSHLPDIMHTDRGSFRYSKKRGYV
jgi:hypothetical protein